MTIFMPVLSNFLGISVAAILGVLTRVYVNSLFGPERLEITSPEDTLFYDLPSNILGCFFLGAFNSLKSHISIPSLLGLALSTGYAGSVTTFASWNYQLVRMLVLGNWLRTILAIILGMSLSISAYKFGTDSIAFFHHVYNAVAVKRQTNASNTSSLRASFESSRSIPATNRSSDEIPVAWRVCSPIMSTTLLTFAFAVALSTTIAIAINTSDDNTRTRFISAALSPLGAFSRFALSGLNGRAVWPYLPLGTLSANLLAVLLDVIIGSVLLIRSDLSILSRLFCQALITGFAGSLSTVSTFVAEILALPLWKAYVYAGVSLLLAQVIGILIYGTVYWGFTPLT